MKLKVKITLLILFIVSIAVLIVFSLPNIKFSDDEIIHKFIADSVPRIIVGIDLLILIILYGYKKILKPFSKKLPKSLLWCVPCLLVALANFPFTAIFGGKAVIERVDLIWLFAIKCLSIGLMEEMFFRGFIQTIILEKFEKRPNGIVISVIISSTIFGLSHLINLFFGAGFAPTILQIGYSFLIGTMLSAVLIKTQNIWLCVFLHALFDFGGAIITDLGRGPFQDFYFWLFTIIAGLLCAVHIIFSLKKTKTCYVYEKKSF